MKIALLLISTLFLFLSCNKDEKQGIKSIVGTWNVNHIESIYGNYTIENNVVIGTNETDRINESGDLGQFNFGKNEVDFNFTRNDTVYSESSSWELQLEKVNSGFTKTNKWKLIIANEFTFDLTFEDDTKNSEKKADNVEFRHWPSESGFGVGFVMSLEKE
ncbi:hypothetical protein [Brumimicrobium mesophilum]|uniref:hypothetical protein n=1 Tax=Brumimicrobium mesophilum TaxID=392717 RepID=UPI000D144ADB|nr:hypothetical protein [Brumimicrobium mesophilum]